MMEMEIYATDSSHEGIGDDNSLVDALGSGVIETSVQQAGQDTGVVTIRQPHTSLATTSQPEHSLQAPVACRTSSSKADTNVLSTIDLKAMRRKVNHTLGTKGLGSISYKLLMLLQKLKRR